VETTRTSLEFDLIDFTPYLLAMALEVESEAFSKVYKSRYNMTRTEWRVLFHLGRYGEMTARDIGQRSRIHKTKISRAVRALEDKRFLKRRTIDTDRRSETLSLQPAGQAAYRDLTLCAARFEGQLERRLGSEDTRKLRQILRTLGRLE
jgi:DNA-binding MarR family transcriptional regulator